MNIIVIGLNHKSAPIEIREQLAFDDADTVKALGQFKRKFPEAEFVLISTCNRVELYCVSGSSEDIADLNSEELGTFLLEFHNLALNDFHDFLYVHHGADAVRHLLMVASSLDSMVVGESQIIAQVKESFSHACNVKSTGKVLNRLFHRGFATGKKVHTITAISSGRVSVPGVAVELSKQLFADVSCAEVVVIGAGEMSELLVQHFLSIDCKNITIINRSYDRALDVAQRHGINARKWEEFHEQLIGADIVVGAAGGQDYLFEKDSFREIADQHRGTLLIIDIAVPRNFDPAINELEDIYLYSVDDLSAVVEQNRKAREDDVSKAMLIVDESVEEFMDWFNARDIGPLIGQMREQFARISQKEMDGFFSGLRQSAPCKQVAEAMVKRVVNRLVHCVIKNVDVMARKHGPAEAAKLVNGIVEQAEKISSGTNNKEDAKL